MILASPVKRNDVVVFNFPVNDTLINDEEKFGSKTTYYEAVRQLGYDRVWQDFGNIIITRPVDKRENFIKRCVAVGGDELQIINGIVHINGKAQDPLPESQRYYYLQVPPNTSYPDKDILESWGIKVREDQGDDPELQQSVAGQHHQQGKGFLKTAAGIFS
ncbi:MAG: S26 family signal peptidase [Ferruginibacter sp.]